MQDEQLRHVLEDLHFQLLRLEPLDQASQEKADELAAYLLEIQTSPDLKDHRASLEQQLTDSITDFEVSHPQLTRLMAEVMRMLSNIGI